MSLTVGRDSFVMTQLTLFAGEASLEIAPSLVGEWLAAPCMTLCTPHGKHDLFDKLGCAHCWRFVPVHNKVCCRGPHTLLCPWFGWMSVPHVDWCQTVQWSMLDCPLGCPAVWCIHSRFFRGGWGFCWCRWNDCWVLLLDVWWHTSTANCALFVDAMLGKEVIALFALQFLWCFVTDPGLFVDLPKVSILSVTCVGWNACCIVSDHGVLWLGQCLFDCWMLNWAMMLLMLANMVSVWLLDFWWRADEPSVLSSSKMHATFIASLSCVMSEAQWAHVPPQQKQNGFHLRHMFCCAGAFYEIIAWSQLDLMQKKMSVFRKCSKICLFVVTVNFCHTS